jgi:hypothetical protein
MRFLRRLIFPLGLAAVAAACGGGPCACGLADGGLVEVSPAADGTCASLATPSSQYEYCVSNGATGAVSPFDVEPRLRADGDTAMPWGTAPVLRAWTP